MHFPWEFQLLMFVILQVQLIQYFKIIISCVFQFIMTGSSESDDDYIDVFEEEGESEEVVRAAKTNKNGKKVRGEDLNWVEIQRFDNAKQFKKSDIAKQLKKEFSARKKREFVYADVEIYHCKHSRKVNYIPCPWKMKVSFLSDSLDVIVETLDGLDSHEHEEDPNYADQEHSVFKWTVAQNNIIEQCLKVQKNSKPNYIKRLLKKSNAFGLRQPTQLQLYNKIATVKKKLSPSENILNTFQLRQKISECVDIPESEVKGYIPYWEIIDENEKEEPRFCVVFSTVKNQRKLNSSRILQSDATYRINWMGFPMIVIGNYILDCICFLSIWSVKSLSIRL